MQWAQGAESLHSGIETGVERTHLGGDTDGRRAAHGVDFTPYALCSMQLAFKLDPKSTSLDADSVRSPISG